MTGEGQRDQPGKQWNHRKNRLIQEVKAQNAAEADSEVQAGTKTGGKVLQILVLRKQKAYTVRQLKTSHRNEAEAEAEAGQGSPSNTIDTEIHNLERDDTNTIQIDCNNVRHAEKVTPEGVEIVCLWNTIIQMSTGH